MSSKNIHQARIAELKKIHAELADAGADTAPVDAALERRDFDEAERIVRSFREFFTAGGHGGSYRENFMSEAENAAAERFLKDAQK